MTDEETLTTVAVPTDGGKRGLLVNVPRTQPASRHETVHVEYSLVGVDVKFTSFQTELQQAVCQFMANGTQMRKNVRYLMCKSYVELS